ncbi:PpiC-type peptidyl-prolyl cis-trans isomerase [Thermoclostridium stercorarium subsp. stercorarium DSM 8532]|uniref:PpiC-type peptidyl-prolyl cis-trans isomerase n=3 Tax=Thermoclostridium stercorarium TaxID=1510 RepID=L7VLX3_THES1|nr:peptidylprolyl isomerase [Thermoclostridium stercorarium]AGC67511.1 PpiC-type peptidyl-prolyl cis-trans isomerase [Thermoclostridium stercorarium subsp. stercorarium DSM 8532]AGI38564.1 peptidyl-prolyl isomerase [Thermoclostridium stercorarium subsp. stercorarium DSM 8532]ANW97937.1 peptidylprolyl isomerase [Thermoclostridium stercorarium subsp. thermolacticum DSM 2910]ANX00487.1 peptidylprolyl isomerase [Thermoclostridium stercorarium subsp. leptospartum DSM 9219]UZQ86096.1 peptidylprolyl 
MAAKSKAKTKANTKPKVKKQLTTDMKIFIVVCTVVTLILAAAIVYIAMPKDIAVVNKNRITNAEFKFYFSRAYQQYAIYYILGQIDENSLVELAKQQALNNAVEVEYLLQEAEKENFTVSDDELETSWNEFDTSLKNQAQELSISINTLSRQVYGIRYEKLKDIYKNMVKAQKYYEKIMDGMEVNEDELKAYYEENKDSFDYNTVRHILIKCDEDAEESVVEEKRKTAQSILDRINSGEDFAELAKKYSEDDGTKENGGLYEIKKNDTSTVEEFKEWAFSHKVGDTGIVKTKFGFHVMKLEKVTDTFEELKDEVEESYKLNKYQTAFTEALNSGEYKIEVKDAYYDFTGI